MGSRRRQVRKWLTREIANTPYWFILAAAIAFVAIIAVVLLSQA